MTIAASSVSPTTDPSSVEANASAKSFNPNPIFDGNSGTKSDVEQGHGSTSAAQAQGAQEAKEEEDRARNVSILIIISLVISVILDLFFFWAGVALLAEAIYSAVWMINKTEELGIKPSEVKFLYLATGSMVITLGLNIAWYAILSNGSYVSSSTGEVTYEEGALITAGTLGIFSWLLYALAVIFTGVFLWAHKALNNATVGASN